MYELIIISFFALAGSLLTLYSGFGLGTILLPVFSLFFPLPLAITLTAIVHLINNVFKLLLLGRHSNWRIILRFGIPSIPAAILGAWVLNVITDVPVLYEYQLGGNLKQITIIKITIGLLMIVFAMFEVIPSFSKWTVAQKWLPAGGIISGFFGGLSGHQGALRSAFLLRTGMSKESFIATGVVIACIIDFSRISTYALHSESLDFQLIPFEYLIIPLISACTGAYIGYHFLKKITIRILHITVAAFLMLFSGLMIAGIL